MRQARKKEPVHLALVRKAHTASYSKAHIKTDIHLATAHQTADANANQPPIAEAHSGAYSKADSATYLEAYARADARNTGRRRNWWPGLSSCSS